jgi:hypothetical protein
MGTAVKAHYAKVDPALAIASLFRPVTRGRRPRALELVTEHDGLTLTWRSFEYLDSRDQSILYACAALAAMEQGGDLHSEAPGETGQQLWLDLDPEERAKVDRAVAFDTTYYRVLLAAGMSDSAPNYERVKNILSRLSDVTIRAQRDGYDWKMRLLSYAARPDGRISIAMNPRMAAALDGQHVRVSLHERRVIGSDVAQIAHGWISAWIRPGRTQEIGVDKLAGHIWGVETNKADTKRQRRRRTIASLDEIGRLEGWQISIEGTGAQAKARIKRPKLLDAE